MSSLVAPFPGTRIFLSKWGAGERCLTICWDMLWKCTQLKLANHLDQHLPLKALQKVSSYAYKWEGGNSERLCSMPTITQQMRGRLQTQVCRLSNLPSLQNATWRHTGDSGLPCDFCTKGNLGVVGGPSWVVCRFIFSQQRSFWEGCLSRLPSPSPGPRTHFLSLLLPWVTTVLIQTPA